LILFDLILKHSIDTSYHIMDRNQLFPLEKVKSMVDLVVWRKSGQNWPNREWNDPREILIVFESLGGVFSETSEYRSSRWRPK